MVPAVRDILQGLEQAPFATDMEAIGADIADTIYTKLFAMSSRALVLEMAAAQSTGLLQGDTPQDRFWYFTTCLRNPEFARLVLMQYPMLVRQATIVVRHCRDSLMEFAERLMLDAPEVTRLLSPGHATGPLTRLRLSAGDTHRRGRGVIIAEFAGGEQKVVYKPRSLTADRCFGDLLSWLNKHGLKPQLESPQIIERENYGWVEHVAPAHCKDAREVGLFYRRKGVNVALLYFLKGTDLHSENIIAAGSQPILVDLEALFHPTFGPSATTTATGAVQRAIEWSAVATGILPVRPPRATRDDEWLDMSGMSGAEERRVPFELPVWVNFDSDEMRMKSETTTLGPDSNLPILNGVRTGPSFYAEAIVEGFTDAYELVCANRDALLRSDGPLAAFSDIEVRVIARNTARYEQIIHDSFHPKFLGNAGDREAFFDTLWSEVDAKPVLEKLHRAERADLWNCDIPFFTTKPSSLTLRTSTGDEIAGAFESSPLREVIARIENAGPRDLALQQLLIGAALAEPEHGTMRWPLAAHDMGSPGTKEGDGRFHASKGYR